MPWDSKTIESDALIELDEIELARSLVALVILPVLLPLLLSYSYSLSQLHQYFLIGDERRRLQFGRVAAPSQ